ncbi:MAG: type II secretion system major pseudopilin GspG [Gammaproteobacteria bacterium]|nr:type II secretion system major pseudopilin GspG [Gammaproteobacteria bacterium]
MHNISRLPIAAKYPNAKTGYVQEVRYSGFAGAKTGGFTLIEVMVVVVILGILASVIIPKIMDRPDAARVVKTKHDIRAIESSLNLYKLDSFHYPSTDQGLEALVAKPAGSPEPRNWKAGGYLERLPKDPWGNDYQYLKPGEKGSIDIYSLGADGQLGGEDYAADIGNWDLD